MAKWTRRDQALRKMRALPERIRSALASQLRIEAEVLAAKIQVRVPVDTGELFKTVKVWPGGSPSTKAEKADPQLTVDITEGGVKGQKGEHVRPVEFGTADTAPQPHFYPTYRQNRTKIRRNLRRAIKAAADQVAKS